MRYFKTERNIFFKWVCFLIFLGMLVFIFWRSILSVIDVVFFPSISQILITGNRFYTTDDEIRQVVLNVRPIGNFITCDIQLIQKKIKCLTWIKQVSVRKYWPDKIKIYIVEYVPVAYWNCPYIMLTRDAVVFAIPQEKTNQKLFPVLFGPIGSEKDVLKNYYMFNEILEFGIYKLRSVSMDSRYSWQIMLENDIKLILGKEDCVARLERFIKFYPVFLKKYMNGSHEFIDYIDLRYASGCSIKTIQNSLSKIN